MITIKTLSNGIKVVLEPMPYFRSAAIGVYVKVGSAYEDEQNNGISHVIEHMLFKGTKTRTAKDLADEMAFIGGDVNAYTAKEVTSYYAKVLDEELPAAISLLGDMITHSLIDEKELDKELGVILEEIDMYEDSPEDLVLESVQEIAWKNHPLGYVISGKKSVVKKFSRDDILAFMNDFYVSGNMVISVAGSFHEDETLMLLEEAFKDIKNMESSVLLTKPAFHQTFSVIDKDIEQAHLSLAYESVSYNSKGKYPLSIMNNVLGGSMNSRLFQRIREDKGMVYSIYSFGSSFQQSGMFQIYAAMNPSQTLNVLQEIYEVIDELHSNNITIHEIKSTKQQIKAELLMSMESTKSRMSSNGKCLLHRGFIVPTDTTLRHLEQVTQLEIQNHIDQYLSKQKVSFSIVGNCNSLDTNSIEKTWASQLNPAGV